MVGSENGTMRVLLPFSAAFPWRRSRFSACAASVLHQSTWPAWPVYGVPAGQEHHPPGRVTTGAFEPTTPRLPKGRSHYSVSERVFLYLAITKTPQSNRQVNGAGMAPSSGRDRRLRSAGIDTLGTRRVPDI